MALVVLDAKQKRLCLSLLGGSRVDRIICTMLLLRLYHLFLFLSMTLQISQECYGALVSMLLIIQVNDERLLEHALRNGEIGYA